MTVPAPAPTAPNPLTSGARLARAPFVGAVLVVYVLSFASQVLLSPPVTSRTSVVPFVVAQIVLIGLWVVLHRRRLRDAGRPSGLAVGVACIYALEVALLAILVGLILSGTSASASSEGSIFQLFVLLYFLTLMTGDTSLGALQAWMIGFTVLMLLPVAIALIFSVWTAMRPRLPPSVVA